MQNPLQAYYGALSRDPVTSASNAVPCSVPDTRRCCSELSATLSLRDVHGLFGRVLQHLLAEVLFLLLMNK